MFFLFSLIRRKTSALSARIHAKISSQDFSFSHLAGTSHARLREEIEKSRKLSVHSHASLFFLFDDFSFAQFESTGTATRRDREFVNKAGSGINLIARQKHYQDFRAKKATQRLVDEQKKN